MKMPGKCTGPKYLPNMFGTWEKKYLESHDLARKVDRQGRTMIWCRRCSGYAGQRVGPTLLDCCRPEQVGTKKYGKIFERIPIPGKMERKKRRITRKE